MFRVCRVWIGAAVAAVGILVSGIAGAAGLDGFDPVTYFSGDKPVKGSEQFMAAHLGETYHFSSAENRDQFTANPDRFLPQYGGHCAWAVAQGKLAPGNASVFKVVDGKLYLNINNDVASRWEKDIPRFIQSADQSWPKLKK